MWKHLKGFIFIYICTSIAWFILAGVTASRTSSQDHQIKRSVESLWGSTQSQSAPSISYTETKMVKYKTKKVVDGKETVTETEKIESKKHDVDIEKSDIKVNFDLDYRKKGLLWYSTYRNTFNGSYTIKNNTGKTRSFKFKYDFPSSDGVYDNFYISVDGVRFENIKPKDGGVSEYVSVEPGKEKVVTVNYSSQGQDQWWYRFGSGVTSVKNFTLTMTTNFDRINFPDESISPAEKKKTDSGWELTWKFKNLVSGVKIAMEMPKKLNPGPFVSRISVFAPVSLFFFFFLMFIITAIKKVKIHSVNYFFIATAFFAFHLLMAYLVDHISVQIAFTISAAVSIFLVISYMRLVTGIKFSLVEVGLSQFVYLVLFSSAFFLEGFTGLAITIMIIITLFVVMQITGRVDWDKQFETGAKNNVKKR